MSAWRVIMTDSESPTGVAPVCDRQNDYQGPHRVKGTDDVWVDTDGVYDCCPGPHIETYDERTAARVAELLTTAEAELCS
jgi:hypothetical protein